MVDSSATSEAGAEDGSGNEQVRLLVELIGRCAQQQPTLLLLDQGGAIEWTGKEGGRILVSLAGYPGFVDPETVQFQPDDPEPIRLLLVDRLRDRYGDVPIPAGPHTVVLDWTSVDIVAELDGKIYAFADGVDPAVPVRIVISSDWDVEAELLVEPPSDELRAYATLDGRLEELLAADDRAMAAVGQAAQRWLADGDERRDVVAEAVRTAFASYAGGAA